MRVTCSTVTARNTIFNMLRNIDSCEALIFSRNAALDADSGELRSAVVRLIDEARDQGALLAVLERNDLATPKVRGPLFVVD